MTAAQVHMMELATALNERRIDRAIQRIMDDGTRATPTAEQAEHIGRIAAQLREESDRHRSTESDR